MNSTETYRALENRARQQRIAAADYRAQSGTESLRELRINPDDLHALYGLNEEFLGEDDRAFASRVIEGIYANDLKPLAESLGLTAIHVDENAPRLDNQPV